MTITLNEEDTSKLNQYQKVIYEQVIAILAASTDLPVDYENSSVKLLNDENGFTLEYYIEFTINKCSIYLILEETNYIFWICGWHANDYYDDDGAFFKHDEIPNVLKLFIEGDAKILEYRCNGKPYKWKLCVYKNGKWVCGQTTADSLLLRIGIRTKHDFYLKKHSERKYFIEKTKSGKKNRA
ncbi:MAG TPA: hypothetical protein PKH33_14985 [bacterium]|nr:hypothetical protein [bacterium]